MMLPLTMLWILLKEIQGLIISLLEVVIRIFPSCCIRNGKNTKTFFKWYQKSRAKWIEFGDQNTSYFHGVTTIGRRKNFFKTLQNDRGDWVNDPIYSSLELTTTDFFKNLFTCDDTQH